MHYSSKGLARIKVLINAARQGCTVVVPFREEMTKRHLKVSGDLGRVVFVVRLSRAPAESSTY